MGRNRVYRLPQTLEMKLKPDTSPMINLSQHRTPQQYEQTSVLRELLRFALLIAFSLGLVAAFIYAALHTNLMHP
jgi:hypothetical protein